MVMVSKFSTLENFQQLTQAKGQAEDALKEAKIAQQAGIPQADNMVQTSEKILGQINQMLATYFPNGEVPKE